MGYLRTGMNQPVPRGRVLIAALLLLCAICGSCGPSPAEEGGAVLLASPLVFLVGLAVLRLFLFLWRPLLGEARMRWRPLAVTFAALLGLAALGGAATGSGGYDWMGTAFLAFGASYLSIVLILFRVLVHSSPANAFTWPPIVVMAVMLLPAPWLALGGGAEAADLISMVWVFPGFFGYATLPIAVLMMIELIVRRIRHASAMKRAELSEPTAQG
jgi:hypothetical protein